MIPNFTALSTFSIIRLKGFADLMDVKLYPRSILDLCPYYTCLLCFLYFHLLLLSPCFCLGILFWCIFWFTSYILSNASRGEVMMNVGLTSPVFFFLQDFDCLNPYCFAIFLIFSNRHFNILYIFNYFW